MRTLTGILLSLVLLLTAADIAAAESRWINNITINEYNITWGYKETFTGRDSASYKISIDTELGNNDSFVNAWELLKADKESRNKFRKAIENELDVKINNQTSGIELIDVDSSLSRDIIGKTHEPVAIENIFIVTYRLKESIFNTTSIWFLGEPGSPVTISLPAGIDVIDISGMDDIARSNDSNVTQVTGIFSRISSERGELTINMTRNGSFPVDHTQINTTEVIPAKDENITEPASEISRQIREWSIVGIGIVLIVLIYFFKVRKNR